MRIRLLSRRHDDVGRARTGLLLAAVASLLSAPQGLAAQPAASVTARTDSLPLSLDEALQRLSYRHPDLSSARAARTMAESAREEARSGLRAKYLPLASLSVSSQRLAQNQFDAIARRAGVTPAPIDEADPFTRIFTAPNTHTASAVATIRPLDGGVARARLAAASSAVDAALLDEDQTRALLELAIVERYADLQLHRRLQEVADSAVQQAERTRRMAQQSLEAGRAPAFDVWRAEAAVAARRPALIDARRQVRVAEFALRQLVDLPTGVPIRLTAPAEPWPSDSATPGNPPSDTPGATLVRAPLAVLAADAREREARASQQAARRALLPTLDVTVQHQQFAYPLRGSQWAGPWFQNTTVAVSLAVPLDLTGGSVSRVDAAAASYRLAQAHRRAADEAHQRERLDVETLREATAAEWDAAVAGATSAERAYRIAVTRYEVGRSSMLEVQDAHLAWQEALARRARAARDRVVTDARATRLHRLPVLTLQSQVRP